MQRESIKQSLVAQALALTVRWLAQAVEDAKSDREVQEARASAVKDLSLMFSLDEATIIVDSISAPRLRCRECRRAVLATRSIKSLCMSCASTQHIKAARAQSAAKN